LEIAFCLAFCILDGSGELQESEWSWLQCVHVSLCTCWDAAVLDRADWPFKDK
jgi:hypothetical protein